MSGGNTGLNLAVSVLTIYVIFGPIILLAIYAFFDRLAEKEGKRPAQKNGGGYKDKDPALWSDEDVNRYIAER